MTNVWSIPDIEFSQTTTKTDRREQHAEPPVKGPAPSNDVPRQEPKVGTVRLPWHKK